MFNSKDIYRKQTTLKPKDQMVAYLKGDKLLTFNSQCQSYLGRHGYKSIMVMPPDD